jgi:hypothetical protein
MGYVLVAVFFGALVFVISRMVGNVDTPDTDNQGRLWKVLMGLALILVSVPIAGLATFVALPVWWLVQGVTGWHIVGHSGPDVWCFVLVYGLVLGYFVRVRSRRKPQPDPG